MNSRVVEQHSDYDDIQSKSDSVEVLTDECQSDVDTHHSFLQRIWLQFPFVNLYNSTELLTERKIPPIGENSPLLVSDGSAMDIDGRKDSTFVEGPFTVQHRSKEDWSKSILMASISLRDYELARPPTLPANLESISPSTLRTHKWKYSFLWRILMNAATFALFFSSGLESQGITAFPFALNLVAILIFSADIWMQRNLGVSYQTWAIPTIAMMAALLTEMLLVVNFPWMRGRFLVSSIAKPITLFYCSGKARNALEAVGRITPVVLRVVAMELLLILSFAAVACRLYSNFESFHDLSTAWVSLFELSTTAVNPSIWMPLYNESKNAAFFFIIFVITTTLYLHSLVLSVVFQTYVQASAVIHERSIAHREESLRIAFLCLQEDYPEDNAVRRVRTGSIRKTLRLLRPHYNAMKINALVEIVDPSGSNFIDYETFRSKIPQSLIASIRSTPSRNFFSHCIEVTGAVVAVSNFVYVVLLTSQFQAHWFDVITLPAGFAITLLGLCELIARANPRNVFRYTPTDKLNVTFDGLAALAALVSCWAVFHRHIEIELMLTGRAIDMIRIMRFQRIFRDAVRRSGEVFPALVGPTVLVVATQHVFVYFGMAIWGGEIHVGTYGDSIVPFYDLNNFNSYWEGLVTMFQILIVNDWHSIAAVYLFASKHSNPYIVYPFFIAALSVSVSIMLNCLIAFFVGAFVTKLDDGGIGNRDEVIIAQPKKRDLDIDTSWNPRRILATTRSLSSILDDHSSYAHGSSRTNVLEFDVYEREGFDKIMRRVAGGVDDEDAYAKEVCDILGLFERLSPGRSKLGYLVFCQHTMNRFGNRRFNMLADDFMENDELHIVVSDMHSELISPGYEDGPVQREFIKDGKTLRFTASIIQQHPAISLIVSAVDTTSEG